MNPHVYNVLVVCLAVLSCFFGHGQTVKDIGYSFEQIEHDGYEYKVFDFVVSNNSDQKIRTAYFAIDSYEKYEALKKQNNILLVTSASYTSSIDSTYGNPIGFCAEKGSFLNKLPHQFMDAMVVMHDTRKDVSDIEIIDLDHTNYSCTDTHCANKFLHYNPRENTNHTFPFINYISDHKASVFQTQLLYSKYRTYSQNFAVTKVGKNDRGRRLLVKAIKNNLEHQLVVDVEKEDYVLNTAKNVFDLLTSMDYKIDFIINLDTGSRDIVHALIQNSLKNLRPNPETKIMTVEYASSLLVYYTPK